MGKYADLIQKKTQERIKFNREYEEKAKIREAQIKIKTKEFTEAVGSLFKEFEDEEVAGVKIQYRVNRDHGYTWTEEIHELRSKTWGVQQLFIADVHINRGRLYGSYYPCMAAYDVPDMNFLCERIIERIAELNAEKSK
jgi:hypothetical protein